MGMKILVESNSSFCVGWYSCRILLNLVSHKNSLYVCPMCPQISGNYYFLYYCIPFCKRVLEQGDIPVFGISVCTYRIGMKAPSVDPSSVVGLVLCDS